METIRRIITLVAYISLLATTQAQPSIPGYKNPILHTDYSDPDVIRVGTNYYMTASSFNFVPGLPLLQSTDLVHWQLIGYALKRNTPDSEFRQVQHGGGVWAPSIRFVKNRFVIYYPDPDRGIYKVEAKKMEGPWTDPQLVLPGKGLIDPCFVHTAGRNYLVYALAGSRAGLKSVILLRQLNADCTAGVGEPKLLYDGHPLDPTIEGPKVYQRKGWFYLFAPAGGVKNGWQVVLRSRKLEGPYERRVVLQQGNTGINGPHQGAWVMDTQGRDWFFHFQDKASFGRVVHLQPMRWVNDWPEMGDFQQGRPGEPVLQYGRISNAPAKNDGLLFADHFSSNQGWSKHWQWSANPGAHWAFTYNNQLRLFSVDVPKGEKNLWTYPAWFTLKLPADQFMATMKLQVEALLPGEEAGWGLLGTDYARMFVQRDTGGLSLHVVTCNDAPQATAESDVFRQSILVDRLFFRIKVTPQEQAYFSYSFDGEQFFDLSAAFNLKPGKWVGARLGLFCLRQSWSNDAGSLGVDWLIIQ